MTSSRPTVGPARAAGHIETGALEVHYREVERAYSVRENGDYEQLVTANGNALAPFHRWFRLKEAFSHRLLPRVLKDLRYSQTDELRLLDPFAGSGTSAVSLSDLVTDGDLSGAYFLGYECNPFLQLVASAKLHGVQTGSRTFLSLAKRLAAAATRRTIEPVPVPGLSTFADARFFLPETLDALLCLRAAIDRAANDGESPLDIELSKLCLGAIVEPVSRLGRDGRALRYAGDKAATNAVSAFLSMAETVDSDMDAPHSAVRGRVQLGDARTLRPRPPRQSSVDLVFFSPPYPNNIDYTEVYKLEAWLLGQIESQEQFRTQRLKTLYSHPSVLRRSEGNGSARSDDRFGRLLEPLLAAVPSDRYQLGRKAMLEGYASDMLETLRACFAALRPGGDLVYVVGNSAHGVGGASFVVAADLIIAELATMVGFEITSIDVARQPRRRRVDSEFVRESVVFGRRPEQS